MRQVFRQLIVWLKAAGSSRSPLFGREKVPLEHIQSTFYPHLAMSPLDFSELWRDIAGTFRVPHEQMRPTDRFGVELPLLISLAGNDEDVILGGVIARFEKRLGIATPIADPKTVDELITRLTLHAAKPCLTPTPAAASPSARPGSSSGSPPGSVARPANRSGSGPAGT